MEGSVFSPLWSMSNFRFISSIEEDNSVIFFELDWTNGFHVGSKAFHASSCCAACSSISSQPQTDTEKG
jgi:hypothetical protein